MKRRKFDAVVSMRRGFVFGLPTICADSPHFGCWYAVLQSSAAYVTTASDSGRLWVGTNKDNIF